MDKMKAIVLDGPQEYGLKFVDIPEPGFNEVLVKIHAVAICGSDPRIFAGESRNNGWPPYYPFIAGHEFAGEVVKLGLGESELNIGDRVAGEAHCGCGICNMCKQGYYTLCNNYGDGKFEHHHYGHLSEGCYAQYQVYNIKSLTKLPDNVTFEEGALVDTAGTALNAIRLTSVLPGGYTVIIGPGPLGLIVSILAKVMGSQTIVIGRGERLKKAKKLGADFIIDYEIIEDVISEVMRITKGHGANQVIEASGNKDTFAEAVQLCAKNGHVAFITIPNDNFHQVDIKSLVMRQITLHGVRANPNCSKIIIDLMSQKKLDVRPLITHKFSIDDIEEAFETFTTRKEGAIKVIVMPWKNSK